MALKPCLVRTYKILDNTDPGEYVALSDANRDLYKLIISAALVDLSDGTTTQLVLWGMFGEGSKTRISLGKLLPS